MSANLSVNTQDPTPTAETKELEPTVEPILISPEQLEKLKKCLGSKSISPNSKNLMLVNTYGKCMCGLIPEFKLIYQDDGVKKVEKYCSKCLSGRDKIIETEKGLESRITIVESCSEYIKKCFKRE